jgi:7,8-dihydropterin-6-yl-methyl-4-(beta-D-ribofuranosyl)aminobenzene 5'-phosphate synthase
VLVDGKAEDGFLEDAGVSWLFRTDRGSLLFDVGFGPERPALAHNAEKLGVTLPEIGALAISHLHLDHMGGLAALRAGQVRLPEELGSAKGQKCYLPAAAVADGFGCEVVTAPRVLSAGVAMTGPLGETVQCRPNTLRSSRSSSFIGEVCWHSLRRASMACAKEIQ